MRPCGSGTRHTRMMNERKQIDPAETLGALSRAQLEELVTSYARNLLALDGLWFQAVERTRGMDEAMAHDCAVWARFPAIEARRIKELLDLGERPGLDGLERALALRFTVFANRSVDCAREEGALVFRVVDCRVQSARTRKGMPLHPCRPVGVNEYTAFARAIDPRIRCEAISCYPEVTDPGCACAWRFTIGTEE